MTADILNLGQMIATLSGNGPNKSLGTKCSQGGPKRSFADVMQSIIQKAASENKGSTSPVPVAKSKTRGTDIAALLKNHCREADKAVEKTAVTDEALVALEKLLIGAGFDSDAVADMIAELKTGDGKSKVMLTDVVAAIEKLDESLKPQKDRNGEEMLEISALPYIESILSRLGLVQDKISEVIAGAVEEGHGINLSRLVANLQPAKGASFWNEKPLPNESIRNRTEELLSRIGLDDFEGKGAKSLDGFIARLEKLLGTEKGQMVSEKILKDDINRFIEKTVTENGENGSDERFNFFKLMKDSRYAKAGDGENGLLRPYSTTPKSFSEKNTPQRNINNVELTDKMKIHDEGKANDTFIEAAGEGIENLEISRFAEDEKMIGRQSAHRTMKTGTLELAALQDVKDANAAKPHGVESAGDRTATRTLPAYVLDQVGRQIVRSAERGDNELLLKLKPAHLGRIQMSIANSSDGLKVSIITEHEAAKDMLMRHSHELKTALMDQGIRLEKIDVQTAFNFDQFTADTRQESNGFRGGKKQAGSGRSNERKAVVDEAAETSSRQWRENGSLNLVA